MIIAIVFFVLFLALYVGATIYVPSRLAKWLEMKRPRILKIIFTVGAVAFPLAMILHRAMANGVSSIFYLAATTWAGMFVYLLTLTLVFELINLAFKPPKKISAFVIIALAALVTIYSLWNAASFRVNHLEIPINGLEKEICIVHISDVHIDGFRGKGYLEEIVAAAGREKPDLVLITGDIIDNGHSLTEETFSPLKKFAAPVYFTAGNHETYAGKDKTLRVLAANGVTILRNQVIETHAIRLIGLDYMNADPESFDMHGSRRGVTIKEFLAGLDLSVRKPTVLMHHSPKGVEYVSRSGVDLMLAGHTHGGQIFPVTYLGRLVHPYNKGLYKHNGTYIYVSQGAGTFGPRMRLGTRNEITVIRLKKSEG